MKPLSRILIAAAALAAGTGCTITSTKAGPTYWGDTREEARLTAIAARPSDQGTREAVNQWRQHPDWTRAQDALYAALPAYAGPLEEKFGDLAPDQQRAVLAYAGGIHGDEASALVLRLSSAGGMIDEGIAALAGKQDAAAVQGLLDLARTGPDATRVAAVKALEPPDTTLARDGLIALAAADNPGAIRHAAVEVLAPYAQPEVRAAMFALVAGEDSDVTASILDLFDAPHADAEVTAGLTATSAVHNGPAAARFLDRMPALPTPVLERFHALADPAAAVDPAAHGTRYEAAAALVKRADLSGAPALVQLLDDDAFRAPSETLLDGLIIASLSPLRTYAPALVAPNGKAEAARLLARFGGPVDEALITTLAAPNERDALVAGLAQAPYGLFPDGTVRYTAAQSDLAGPTPRKLEEVIAEGRDARGQTGDPVLAYIGAARAYLAGARSRPDLAALAAAAEAAKGSFGLAFDNHLSTGSTGLSSTIGAQVAATTSSRSGAPVLASRGSTLIPAASLSGSLSCAAGDHVERDPLTPSTYYYTVTVVNPNKEVLRQRAEAVPYSQRTKTECSMVCYCYVQNEGSTTYNLSCDASTPSVGSCNCNQTTTTSADPYYSQLVADYNAEPDTIDEQLSVSQSRTRVTQVHAESCNGPLTVAIGTMTHKGTLAYAGEKRDWVVHSEAQPLNPDGTRLAAVAGDGEPGQSDNRAANLESAVNGALADFAPTTAQIRAMYAGSVKPAVAKGDARAARDTLVWSDPALIGTDAASLQHFQATFIADGDGAFPNAWR